MVHDVLKNELAAGVLPCGRFGANAAWLRLAVITHNVLTALKRLALPAEYLSARPQEVTFSVYQRGGPGVAPRAHVALAFGGAVGTNCRLIASI